MGSSGFPAACQCRGAAGAAFGSWFQRIAPLVCVASVFAGLMLANQYDFPPGQIIVAVQAALLVGAWASREFRLRFAA